MYLCGPGKHNCQPFCGPEGRFYCSDSVCSLWPAPFSYLCVSVMILGVLKTVCGWTSKNWLLPYACCGLHFIDSTACVLSCRRRHTITFVLPIKQNIHIHKHQTQTFRQGRWHQTSLASLWYAIVSVLQFWLLYPDSAVASLCCLTAYSLWQQSIKQ